jgi:hypothetical protein
MRHTEFQPHSGQHPIKLPNPLFHFISDAVKLQTKLGI